MNSRNPAALQTTDAEIVPSAVISAPAADSAAETGGSSAANRLAVASFVCGLLGVILLPVGIIPGFLGLVLGMDARRRGSTHPRLDAARILSILAIAGMPLLLVALLSFSCQAALFML